MNKNELIKLYYEWQDRVNSYTLAISTISYERQTFAPEQGKAYANKMASILSGEYYQVATDLKVIEIMNELEKIEDLEEDLKIEIKQRLKEVRDLACIPKEVYVEYSKLLDDSNVVWEKAKNSNDFDAFEPYLIKVVDMSKKIMEYRGSTNPYNTLIDDYEPGFSIDKYEEFFDLVEDRLVPLIKRIMNEPVITNDFLHKEVPLDIQESISKGLLKYLKYTSDWGYLTTTEHPFSMMMSIGDCRITTKYLLNEFTDNMFSIIHETGHATYNHQVDVKYDGRYVGSSMSSGMHESQSRLMENYLGRTKSFWKSIYSILKDVEPLKDVDLDEFVKGINTVNCSLIRTSADELTYPVHILIRYKIEKGLFDGSIPKAGLNKLWNKMYKEYLGVDVPSDKVGILQDVHWSYGYFGYFPTYALGSAYAAQMMHQMRKDIDVDSILESGDITLILEWLKSNIHQYGGLYDANTILERVTGEVFNPKYYIDYLTDKYSKIYSL